MTPPNSAVTEDGRRTAAGTTDIIRLLNLTMRQIRVVVACASIIGLGTALYTLLRARTYTSTAGFLLQPPKVAGNMPGLAAQLGLTLPMSDPGQSPAFYAEMIKSRDILSALADSMFTYRDVNHQPVTASLAQAYKVRARDSLLLRERTFGRLNRSVTVRTSARSGVVTFSVEAPAPELAQRIANGILDELSYFNMQRRQSQAAAERRFTERRLVEVRADLRAAEDALADFLRRNRAITNSPQLKFDEQRLTTEVELRRTLYSQLAQSYEQSKIDEVRDTPQLTIVERPEVPVLPDARMLVGKTFVAILFGFVVGLLIGMARERVADAKRHSAPEVAEFARLRDAAFEAVKHPFRSHR